MKLRISVNRCQKISKLYPWKGPFYDVGNFHCKIPVYILLSKRNKWLFWFIVFIGRNAYHQSWI